MINILFPALFLNIFFDHLPVSISAHGCEIVSISSEFTAPEELFYFRNLFEQLFGCNHFEQSYHLVSGVFRKESAENVDMVLIEADVSYLDCEPFLEFFDRFQNYTFCLLVE